MERSYFVPIRSWSWKRAVKSAIWRLMAGKTGDDGMDVLDETLSFDPNVGDRNGKKPKSRQLTIKGFDEGTVHITREAAKKRGLRMSSWIRMELHEAALRTLNGVVSKSMFDERVIKNLVDQLEEIKKKQELERSELEQIRTHLSDIITIQHQMISGVLKDR